MAYTRFHNWENPAESQITYEHLKPHFDKIK